MVINILTIGGIGSLVFTCFILFMGYSGIAAAMRDEEGKFKKELNWKSLTGGIAFICFLPGLLYLGNISYAKTAIESPGFLEYFLNAFGIFLIVHLYDLIVLDYLIVVKWHPSFLKLPDTDYYNKMAPHLKGFARGIPIGLVASLLVSSFSIFAI